MLMKVLGHPGHGNSKRCIVGDWKESGCLQYSTWNLFWTSIYLSEQAENLIIIWRLLCMFFLHQTETTPVFFPLPSSSNLDMFWPLHSPSNHIKYLRCGLFSLDPPHKHLSLLSLVKRPTFPACFILIPSKISQFRLFFFIAAGCPLWFLLLLLLFLYGFLLWFIKQEGSPLVFFPVRSAGSVVGRVLIPRSFALLKLRSELGNWCEPFLDFGLYHVALIPAQYYNNSKC